jgi:hypothetical protein
MAKRHEDSPPGWHEKLLARKRGAEATKKQRGEAEAREERK